jgi:tetratricopeptide (TPR) repeat protein
MPVLANGLDSSRSFAPVRSSAWVMQSLAELHEDRGDLDAARKGHEEVLALHDKLGEGVQLQRSRLALARVHLRAGRAVEAEQLIRKAMGEIDRQRLENDRCHAHLLLALVLDRQGKRAEALAAWAVAEPLAKDTQAYYLRVRKAEARGLLHATHGSDAERRAARTALEEMVADTRRSGFVGYRLELELALALVERALGDGADADARLAEVEKDARAHGYGALAGRAQELAKASGP